MKIKFNKDMSMDHLNENQKKIAMAILEGTTKIKGSDYVLSGGGCKAFYTPEEWEDRQEMYGLQSELVIVHDGGDLAPCFNHDYMSWDHMEAVQDALFEIGYFAEQCTSWYTAIYRLSAA